MEKYKNREEAGRILAQHLDHYRNRPNYIVIALPRGGVPVAYEVAKALHLPLDILIIRKLGVPAQQELAMGAIASGDISLFNYDIIKDFEITKNEIKQVIEEEKIELNRREKAYRGNVPFSDLRDKNVILIDDGIATGATLKTAIKSIKQLSPQSIIVGVPVAQKSLSQEFALLVNDFVAPMQPLNLQAVGVWYDDFSQTEDEEVHRLLKQAKRNPHD